MKHHPGEQQAYFVVSPFHSDRFAHDSRGGYAGELPRGFAPPARSSFQIRLQAGLSSFGSGPLGHSRQFSLLLNDVHVSFLSTTSAADVPETFERSW